MKEQLQRIIAELDRLIDLATTDDERRLLQEAKSRLITIWQGRQRRWKRESGGQMERQR